MVSSLYEDLIGVVSTKSWKTAPIHLQIGVFQGDPLSVLVFNTVMNILVDTITKRHSNLGYMLAASSQRSNLLQYADDTSLLSDGPSSCQSLLSTTEAWLSWSGMKANVPKCVCLAIQASTGRPYDPRLKLNRETIQMFLYQTCCSPHHNRGRIKGFINASSFDDFYNRLAQPKLKEQRELESEVVLKCIQQSHKIWCQRNWLQ